MGVAVSCTADTCPSGSVCCATVNGLRATSTQCQQGECGSSDRQLCSPTVMCPSGETCRTLGGALSYCAPMRDGGVPMRDGGIPMRDGGFPMRDGGFPRRDGGFPPPGDAGAPPPDDAGTD
jgi:hypothetical protein